MKLNGWQRLWVVASGLWSLFLLGAFINAIIEDQDVLVIDGLLVFFAIMFGPIIGVYLVGLIFVKTFLWIKAGFKGDKQ